ncbi:SPDEF factor, partial [Steatornis caripensis]|nr:SPDEF factor [Steatornis caripensis]
SPSPPATPEQPLPAFCLHYFDMLYSEDIAWATKGMEEPSQSSAQEGRGEAQKEPEQCPIIDSQGLGLGAEGDLQGSLHLEEHSLEQVQSMVVGEVLKDIETACKLLNIAAGGCPHGPPRGAAGRVGPRCGMRRGRGLLSLLRDAEKEAVLPDPVPGLSLRRPADIETDFPTRGHVWVPGWCKAVRSLSSPSHPSLPTTGGDASWADTEVDSSCAGQPIHLWQFLKELLLKPHNYGRFIRWLNKEKGIFKIEDSAQVARLWGIRKNRPAMNYDKLSRSIRQYYKKGIIRKPDISQRLVYQFVHPV